jgi:hypothetical protein
MEEGRQDEQWNVDRRQIVGEPLRKVEVGDRAMFSSEGLGKLAEGTAESVHRKDQALAADYFRRQCCTAIGALHTSSIEQVEHARLDREPGESVDALDGHEHCLWVPCLPPARSKGPCQEPAQFVLIEDLIKTTNKRLVFFG